MAKVKVTRNYQVTIPEDVRKKLGIEEGDYVSIETLGKTLAVMKRVIPVEDLAGTWDEEMDKIMEDVRKLWKMWEL
ncbi:MAG: Repressor-like protein SSo7c4 [Candidatus Bathyarchaeota archaeon BA1]|nr:MAG: Repressor-like protein SSo7c4 [Candidatus Bathyarchaeota archaeon BA1]